ncbi:MAG: phage tail tape measure protein, partial [Candidatus Absconditicoccaceae bacterium]
LGIAADDIETFTRVVAQFSALTGITVEATAQAFGRLGNILGIGADQFESLGSAITYVARTSAATEPQIISLAERLGSTATRAGLTAAEVIGLSGAIASLAVAPERAQGVFEKYFNTLNSAVAEGGQSLQNFATLAGKSTDEVTNLVTGGQGLELLLDILTKLGGPNTVATTQALESLGLTGLRVNEVLPRLGNNVGKLRESIEGSAQAYKEAAELQRQFALIADDLNTKFLELVNSVNALIEAATGGNVAGLAGLLQVFIDITNAARGFVETPFGQEISKIALVVTGLVGAFFAYRAAAALATASTYALIVAQSGLAKLGAGSGFFGLIGQVLGFKSATDAATASTLGLRGALVALGKATVILAAIGAAVEVFTNFDSIGDGITNAVNGATGLTDTLKDSGSALYEINGLTVGVENGMIRIGDSAFGVGQAILGMVGPLEFIVNLLNGGLARAGKARGVGPKTTGGLAPATTAANNFATAMDNVGGSAGGAAAEVRTLVDYASDLAQVFSRTADLRFGS